MTNRDGITESHSSLLTKAAANYFPDSSGFAVEDREYYGYEIVLAEATGNDPVVNVTVEVSLDGSTFGSYSQNVIYPIDAAATATLAITDESSHFGSIQPMPCYRMRLVLTEAAAAGGDDDVTATVRLFRQ